MGNIVHICNRTDWERAVENGGYEPVSLAQEGFIHCSLSSKILEVANFFYRGRRNLVLLSIELNDIQSDVRWEKPLDPVSRRSIDTADTFPHIYGPLNLDAVAEVFEFSPGPDGEFRLPDNV